MMRVIREIIRNKKCTSYKNSNTVGLFIIPCGQNYISEPKRKSYKKESVFMITGPK
jgi:hypothetical protein